MTNPRPTRTGFQALGDILDASGDSVLHRAQWLDKVNQRLLALLPAQLGTHVRVADLRDGILVVQVDSPAWNARMRFHTEQVLDAARRVGLDVSGMRVRVAPPPAPPTQVLPTSSPWPPHIVQAIERTLGLRDDPDSGSNHPNEPSTPVVK